MILKIILALALFSSIIFLDLVFFFPAFVIILFILNSIEKDLKTKDRKRILRYERNIPAVTVRQQKKIEQEITV